ncbi:PAS domain S-box protein [Salipaludibacillus aurantiacus]|uniref:PAS domain S-box-containing protein n=1 Tax=Salipaludibacillus aurantiacus TaxID=1601833 RepID=A0A1H9TXS2_9BACI|nr:PAS domain S-box protein [Salipaludibacillus aurantiacus]SES01821.1 PAS domain S-box-containing protein [Salipaludibacillus aurantiacus]
MFKEVIELFEESIIITDKNLYILYINKSYEQLFGLSFKEVEGRHLHEVFPETPDEARLATQTVTAKEGLSFKNINFHWKGRDLVLRVQTKIHYDQKGEIEFVMTQIEDVTENVERQQERDAMIQEMTINIIPVTEEIGILPLHAIKTENQKDIIVENTLIQCRSLGVKYLALDLSSLKVMDEEFAFIISRLLSTLKLLGVKVFISGIQPEVVPYIQTNYEYLSEHSTYQTLHQAIDELLCK